MEVLFERNMMTVFSCNHTFELLVFRWAVGKVANEIYFINLKGGIVRTTSVLWFVEHCACEKSYTVPVDVERCRRVISLPKPDTE
jgi:hypothetical protein